MSTAGETPVLARSYCPGCEPDADPCHEILDVQWCESHAPTSNGLDDARIVVEITVSGSAEAGGEANRRWCDVLHRKRLTR
jgi:hypothetical protein